MERPLLRSLSVPELLDLAIQIYKRHAFLLMSIVAVIYVPLAIVHFVVQAQLSDVAQIVDLALNYLLSPFSTTAIIVAVSSLYLGKDISLLYAFGKGVEKYWSMFWASLLFLLVGVLFGALAGLLSIGGRTFLIPGLFIVFLLLIYLFTRWSLYTPIIMLEDVGAIKAFDRSGALVQGYFWRVFGTSFSATLLALLFSRLPVVLVQWIFSSFTDISPQTIALVMDIFEQLAIIVTLPFATAVNVLVYYDLRIRKEGFDLFTMTDSLDNSEPLDLE
jgi:hypothetical protein